VISLSAGPNGTFHPGSTRILSKEEASILVKGGFAEYSVNNPSEKAIIEPPSPDPTVLMETTKQRRTKK
jgi:hypothetical protein